MWHCAYHSWFWIKISCENCNLAPWCGAFLDKSDKSISQDLFWVWYHFLHNCFVQSPPFIKYILSCIFFHYRERKHGRARIMLSLLMSIQYPLYFPKSFEDIMIPLEYGRRSTSETSSRQTKKISVLNVNNLTDFKVRRPAQIWFLFLVQTASRSEAICITSKIFGRLDK